MKVEVITEEQAYDMYDEMLNECYGECNWNFISLEPALYTKELCTKKYLQVDT